MDNYKDSCPDIWSLIWVKRKKINGTIAGGEKDVAVYLIANENAIVFYEKPGMKKAVDWTVFTVE